MSTHVGENVELRGHYSRWDFICACSLYIGIGPVFRVLGLLLLAGFGWAGGFCLLQGDNYPLAVIGLALPLVSAWLILWYAPHRWNSPFLRHPGGECEIRAGDEGLIFATRTMQREWAWLFFIGWSESAACFQLTLPDGRFEFVPKHLFASREDIAAFRHLLGRVIEPRTRMLFTAKQADTLNRRVESGVDILSTLADLFSGFSKK